MKTSRTHKKRTTMDAQSCMQSVVYKSATFSNVIVDIIVIANNSSDTTGLKSK